MRISLTVFLCLVSTFYLSGQSIGRISLKDSITLQPLSGVLCVLDDEFYYSTDQNGSFHHEFTTDTSYVQVSIYQLGQAPVYRNINILDSIILLPKSSVLLNEVIVSNRADIIEKKDTTVFNAQYFRDSTELNIEELLQKLPGFDIDKETGIIQVNGLIINTIMIEGDDLVGNQYQKISRKLSSDIIDKVEVIKTDDEQGRRSINLLLNESSKDKKIIGSLLSSINTNSKIGEEFTSFINNKPMKSILSLSFKNNGKSSFYGEYYDTNSKLSSLVLVKEKPSLWLNAFEIPFLIADRSNYLENSELIISNDGVVKLPASNLKFNIQFYDNSTIFKDQITERYFDPQIVFTTNKFNSNNEKIGNCLLNYEKKISSNSKLSLSSETRLSNRTNNTSEEKLNPLYDQETAITDGMNKFEAVFTNNISKKTTLEFTSTLNSQKLSQNFSNKYRDSILVKDQFFRAISHAFESSIFRFENTAEATFETLNNTQFNFGLGFLYYDWENNFKNNLYTPVSENLNINSLLTKFSFFKISKSYSLILNSTALVNEEKLYYFANLNHQYVAGKNNFFSKITASKLLPVSHFYSNQYVFSNYNQLNVFDARPVYQQFWKFETNYTYENYEGDFLVSSSLSANQLTNPTIQNISLLNDFISSTTYTENLNKTSGLDFFFNTEYYVEKISSRLKIKPRLGIRNYNFLFDGYEINNSSFERGVKMSLKNNLLSNLQIYVEWNYAVYNNYQNGNLLSVQELNNFKLSTALKTKAFLFNLDGNYYKFSSLQESIFLDAFITFKPRKERFYFKVSALNLLNYKALNYLFQSDYSITELSYPLFGSQVGLKFFYTF